MHDSMRMDTFDNLLTHIITKVGESSLSDEEKADVYAEISVGLHKLVWPILLSHMPEKDLAAAVDNPKDWTMDRYAELISKSLSDPAMPKEIYDELTGALKEIDELVSSKLTPLPSQGNP